MKKSWTMFAICIFFANHPLDAAEEIHQQRIKRVLKIAQDGLSASSKNLEIIAENLSTSPPIYPQKYSKNNQFNEYHSLKPYEQLDILLGMEFVRAMSDFDRIAAANGMTPLSYANMLDENYKKHMIKEEAEKKAQEDVEMSEVHQKIEENWKKLSKIINSGSTATSFNGLKLLEDAPDSPPK